MTVFHRGVTAAQLPATVRIIQDDKSRLESHRPEFDLLAPEVVIHLSALTKADAHSFVSTFETIARRAVVVSSMMSIWRTGGFTELSQGRLSKCL